MPVCFKDDNESQLEINKRLGNLTPAVSKTPEPIVTKFGMGDEVGDTYPYAKFCYDPIRGVCSLPHPVSARAGAKKVTRLVFVWFFRQPTAKTPATIFTINTSNDVVSRKDVPAGGP